MEARRQHRFALALIGTALVLFAAWSARADESAVTSTRDRAAESAFDAISALPDGDSRACEEAGRRFAIRFPRDPLAPRVELAVGRAIVVELFAASEQGEPVDAARLQQGLEWLDRAEAHADAPTLERAHLFRAAALAMLGRDEEAVALARPLEATLTLPTDRDFFTRVTLGACTRAGHVDCVLHALDDLRQACRDETECEGVDERIAEYTSASVDDDDAIRFARSADPTRATFSAIAGRAIRAAAAASDWDSVRDIAERAARASIDLDPESREVARRLDLGRSADPRVIGIVAGLTGPDAQASMAVVTAIADAAGLPPNGRPDTAAFRLVVRDHRGDPEAAARAVSELYWVHRAIAIIGPLDRPSAESAAQRAERLGIPLVSLAPIPSGPFALDASPATNPAWLRDEAERRFGPGIGVVAPAGARAGTAYGPEIYAHAGGRFDAATRARLRATTARALLIVARPAELTRLVTSIDLALRARRRNGRPVVVLDRRSFDRIVAHGRARSIEGAFVLERSRIEESGRSTEADDPNAEEALAATDAFERIAHAGASTRDLLAARLALPRSTPSQTLVRAYRVRRSELVPAE